MKVNFAPAYEDGQVILTAEEKTELSIIDAKLERLMQQRIKRVKGFAKKSGILKPTLSDLKSARGCSFTEHESRLGFAFSTDGERAFLCAGFHNKEPEKGCGWVKGSPIKDGYNSTRAIGRSTGFRQLCMLCGEELYE